MQARRQRRRIAKILLILIFVLGLDLLRRCCELMTPVKSIESFIVRLVTHDLNMSRFDPVDFERAVFIFFFPCDDFDILPSE